MRSSWGSGNTTIDTRIRGQVQAADSEDPCPRVSIVHSTLGAESAHCGPDTPKIYSVEMEDDHTYHKMKMHDNTMHYMV